MLDFQQTGGQDTAWAQVSMHTLPACKYYLWHAAGHTEAQSAL